MYVPETCGDHQVLLAKAALNFFQGFTDLSKDSG